MKPSTTHSSPTAERTTTLQSNTELLENIRALAYEKYEQRGREEGHDLDDWLQAESELTPRQTAKAA